MLPAPLLLRGLLLLTALLLVACSEREAAEPPAAVEAPAVSAVERPVISRKDDLPRHSYQIEIPAVALYEAANREVLMALAEQIRRDAEQDLPVSTSRIPAPCRISMPIWVPWPCCRGGGRTISIMWRSAGRSRPRLPIN